VDDVAALKATVIASDIHPATGLDSLGIGGNLSWQRQARPETSGVAQKKDWEANQPDQLKLVLQTLEASRRDFNGTQSGNKKVSIADMIVLGGCAG
jgi:catalase-peroxidase